MPPTALPAREMLKPPGQTTIAWAVFDADWYLATYTDARAEVGDGGGGVAILPRSRAEARSLSPNIYFDEAWAPAQLSGCRRRSARRPCAVGIRCLLPGRIPRALVALAVQRGAVSPAPSRPARRVFQVRTATPTGQIII